KVVGTDGIDITFNGPVDSASFSVADLTLDERQTITVTNPVTSLTLSFNGTAAASALVYSAATTAAQVQDHLETIPALISNEQQTLAIPSSVTSLTLSFNGVAA